LPTSTIRTISSVSASVTRRPSRNSGSFPTPAHHRIHLRAAAMDEHAANADAAEQQHVLCQGAVELPVDRCAAELHDDRLAGEAADIGKRLNQDARGCVGSHEVLLFSLM
jgi:hypothetical protein